MAFLPLHTAHAEIVLSWLTFKSIHNSELNAASQGWGSPQNDLTSRSRSDIDVKEQKNPSGGNHGTHEESKA
jgi:hypothetical protein